MEKLYDFIRSHKSGYSKSRGRKGWDSLWQIALGKRKPNDVITDVVWEDAVTCVDNVYKQGTLDEIEAEADTSLLERVVRGKDEHIGADCFVISDYLRMKE